VLKGSSLTKGKVGAPGRSRLLGEGVYSIGVRINEG